MFCPFIRAERPDDGRVPSPESKNMQTGILRFAVRALGILCLSLPLMTPIAAEAAGKAKPHAAKAKHKVAAKKHKVVAKKAKATRHAKKAGHRKLAKAHAPKAKSPRPQPAASLDNSGNDRLALPGKPDSTGSSAQEATQAARTACSIGGKVYLLADCQQVAASN